MVLLQVNTPCFTDNLESSKMSQEEGKGIFLKMSALVLTTLSNETVRVVSNVTEVPSSDAGEPQPLQGIDVNLEKVQKNCLPPSKDIWILL